MPSWNLSKRRSGSRGRAVGQLGIGRPVRGRESGGSNPPGPTNFFLQMHASAAICHHIAAVYSAAIRSRAYAFLRIFLQAAIVLLVNAATSRRKKEKRYRDVGQFGVPAWLGARRSSVQVRPSRPCACGGMNITPGFGPGVRGLSPRGRTKNQRRVDSSNG